MDIRPLTQYQRVHIPASVNLAVHAIPTKSFLKGRRVVLVDDGHSAEPLEERCRSLGAAGLSDVRALAGGLQAWRGQGAPLAGDPVAQASLDAISPEQFWRAKERGRWVVLDHTGSSARELATWLPGLPVVRYRANPKALSRSVADAAKRAYGDDTYSVLGLEDDPATGHELAASLSLPGLLQVRRLEGGLAGYRRHLTAQGAMRARLAREPPAKRKCRR